MSSRRKDIKSITFDYQAKRRKEALEKQQSARARTVDARRQISSSAEANAQTQNQQQLEPRSSNDPAHPSGSQNDAQTLREYWASQLMMPEWLIEVPNDLATNWYVLPRPEGQRCTVVASRGQTISRLRNGSVLERFSSGLPSGGSGGGGGGGSSDASILDCIYHAPNQTYYILDVMCWRGHDLYDCTTEFRFFWMNSKLSEDYNAPSVDGSADSSHLRHFVPLLAYPATVGGLQAAYSGQVPFIRDGLYLIHTKSQYHPGQTPLALVWKDAQSSRYFIDTDAKGEVPSEQHVVLRYGANRHVGTADDPPIVLATMPEAFVQKMGQKLRPGRLLKFRLGSGGVSFSNEGIPTGAELHFAGVSNQRRGRADTLSKIVFQMLARTQPITMESLIAAAEGAELAAPGEARDGGLRGDASTSIGVFNEHDVLDNGMVD